MARRIQKNPRDRIESGSWRSSPRPVDWPARVQRVIKRDGSCRWVEHGQVCGSVERLEVDHVDDPTNHDLSNLRALCHAHHKLRTQAQSAAGVRAYHAKRSRKRPPEQHPGTVTT